MLCITLRMEAVKPSFLSSIRSSLFISIVLSITREIFLLIPAGIFLNCTNIKSE